MKGRAVRGTPVEAQPRAKHQGKRGRREAAEALHRPPGWLLLLLALVAAGAWCSLAGEAESSERFESGRQGARRASIGQAGRAADKISEQRRVSIPTARLLAQLDQFPAEADGATETGARDKRSIAHNYNDLLLGDGLDGK